MASEDEFEVGGEEEDEKFDKATEDLEDTIHNFIGYYGASGFLELLDLIIDTFGSYAEAAIDDESLSKENGVKLERLAQPMSLIRKKARGILLKSLK